MYITQRVWEKFLLDRVVHDTHKSIPLALVAPLSLCLQVSLTPAAVRTYSTALVVDVAEAGRGIFSLPISAKSEVPPISLETPYLDYGRCFVQYPYSLNVVLANLSLLPVKYKMQPPNEEMVLQYSTTYPTGVIEPCSTLKLPLEVKAQVQGEIMSTAVFQILGSLDQPLEVAIRCVGEGPVINVSPDQLHWGRYPVLTPSSKMVLLQNESLIQADFECALVSTCART